MPLYNSNFPSEKIKFKNNKHSLIDEHDVEILIPTSMKSRKSFSDVKNGSSEKLNPCLRPLYILFYMILISAVSTAVFIYINESSKSTHKEDLLVSCPKDSCSFQKLMDQVVITVVEGSNYNCSDNTTCSRLHEKIEQEQDGLSFNFVVGSDMELYIGLGFKCQVNCDESTLHIKLIRPNHIKRNVTHSSLRETNRILQVITQGIKCGKISNNFTVSVNCETERTFCHHISHHVSGYQYWRGANFFQEPPHSFHHSPDTTRILLHKEFKWLACPDPSEETEPRKLVKSKVITLESLPKDSCEPYTPVNKVSIDIVETSTITCSDNSSCIEMARRIEEEHDGYKYNFVIGTDYEMYIGLGFNCHYKMEDLNYSLKIKLLKSESEFSLGDLLRLSEIIGHGLVCGDIMSNYSVSVNCFNSNDSCGDFLIRLKAFSYHKYSIMTHLRKKPPVDHADIARKVIQYNGLLACTKRHHSNNGMTSTTKPSTVLKNPSYEMTTIIVENYTSKDEEMNADVSTNMAIKSSTRNYTEESLIVINSTQGIESTTNNYMSEYNNTSETTNNSPTTEEITDVHQEQILNTYSDDESNLSYGSNVFLERLQQLSTIQDVESDLLEFEDYTEDYYY